MDAFGNCEAQAPALIRIQVNEVSNKDQRGSNSTQQQRNTILNSPSTDIPIYLCEFHTDNKQYDSPEKSELSPFSISSSSRFSVLVSSRRIKYEHTEIQALHIRKRQAFRQAHTVFLFIYHCRNPPSLHRGPELLESISSSFVLFI